MSIEAMKQALDALEFIPESGSMLGMQAEAKRIQAITALRQAIEQAEKKTAVSPDKGTGFIGGAWHCQCGKSYEVTCISSKPPKKEWVGLTGDEVNEFAAGCHLGNSVQGAIRKAETKLKEKNT